MANKIVDFRKYCSKCTHYDSPIHDGPCEECLLEPAREDSRKPLKFEPVEKYKKEEMDEQSNSKDEESK